jgi:hypothetical protein
MSSYTIKLIVGDWSNDGHNMSDEIVIFSNIDGNQIRDAFKLGTEVIGFDLTNECSDYEQHQLSAKALACINDQFGDRYRLDIDEDGGVSVTTHVDLYLAIAKLGNAEFEWQLQHYSATIDIGGYGLFLN